MQRRGDIRIGVSGWRYPPWRRNFYPLGLPQKRELDKLHAPENAVGLMQRLGVAACPI